MDPGCQFRQCGLLGLFGRYFLWFLCIFWGGFQYRLGFGGSILFIRHWVEFLGAQVLWGRRALEQAEQFLKSLCRLNRILLFRLTLKLSCQRDAGLQHKGLNIRKLFFEVRPKKEGLCVNCLCCDSLTLVILLETFFLH